jgi:hypothetical protein
VIPVPAALATRWHSILRQYFCHRWFGTSAVKKTDQRNQSDEVMNPKNTCR